MKKKQAKMLRRFWSLAGEHTVTIAFLLAVWSDFLCSSRGSLLTRSLADIVKKDDFVLDSEYLVTMLVVVPKYNLQNYLCDQYESNRLNFCSYNFVKCEDALFFFLYHR